MPDRANIQDYYVERDTIPTASFDDGMLQFEGVTVNE